jgi:hypothetical protein
MSAVTAAAALPAPATPDADWDALHAAALLAIQEAQGPALVPWTDHNVHDPGITLLEAALWALADLHYRTASRSFDTWSAELDDWRGLALARGGDRTLARAELEALLGPAPSDSVDAVLAAATSRAGAVVELTGRTAGTAGTLSAAAAAAVVRLLREPELLRAAFDSAPAIADAVERFASDPAAAAAAAAALDGSGLWIEEIAALVRRERRRRFARMLTEQRELILQTTATAPQSGIVTALETLLSVGAEDAAVALALDAAPRVDPDEWETATGETTIWPPHPLQALTCEPVTPTDYRRLLLADASVARAWVLPGLADGILWNGKATGAFPWRQGAFTFLIEAAAPPADEKAYLRAQLERVLAVDQPGETTTPYRDYQTGPDVQTPRRLLGDELCAALVGTCPVIVAGTLEIGPTANTAQVLVDARARLTGFLSAERIAPFEPPDLPGPALVASRDLEGPWPRAVAAAAYIADPGRERRESGWQPGDPVRVTELIQLLQDVQGVLGVDGLRVQLQGTTAWAADALELDPYCVPAFAGDCLCVRIVDPRECGG